MRRVKCLRRSVARSAPAGAAARVTELDRALVRRKLAAVTRNLGDLGAVEGLGVEEYRCDRFRRR